MITRAVRVKVLVFVVVSLLGVAYVSVRYVGLGESRVAETVEVRWPSGRVGRYDGLRADVQDRKSVV